MPTSWHPDPEPPERLPSRSLLQCLCHSQLAVPGMSGVVLRPCALCAPRTTLGSPSPPCHASWCRPWLDIPAPSLR
eukprot:1082254-Amphidinium_carterae.1